LAIFIWKGIRSGAYAFGEIDAQNLSEAAYLLRQDNLIITSLEEKKSESSISKLLSDRRNKPKTEGKIKPREVMVFSKKLSSMIRAGLPVPDAIEMLIDQIENETLRAVMGEILTAVQSGSTVSEAFGAHEKHFDQVYVNLIRAGEASGKLDVFLDKLVENLEKTEAIRSSIKKAIFYPAILLVVSIVVVVIMLIYVVPIFAELFESAGGELPALTAAVMAASDFVQDPMRGGMLVLISTLSIVGLRYWIKKDYKAKKGVHRLLLRAPLIGDLITKSSMSKVGMILGNLSSAGLPVLEALDIAASSLKNIPLIEALNNVKLGVFSGNPISELFRKESAVPQTFSQMLAVGEETGNMEEMYLSVSRYYEEELDTTVQQMTSVLEPIMIIFMGATVGFIILSMYLPIFSMGQIVG
jgi:type IV pilus assembly protein PilC